MKYKFLVLITFTLQWVNAQSGDSIAVKRVDSLIELSRTYKDQRDFENAFKNITEAEKICINNLGKESKEFAKCFFYRGLVNYDKENYQESEKWYLQSMSMYEKVLGKENRFYANCLRNLSNVYYDTGNYEKSEALNLEELSIRAKTVGKTDPEYFSSVNNLASLYVTIGSYSKAESLNIETKLFCEKTLGKKHPQYINSLTNLAILYFNIANYEMAEPLFNESLALREEIYGKEHPDYAASLNNLGNLYMTMGNFIVAEPLFSEAKKINGKILGKQHSDYVMNVENLGALNWRMGNYSKAELYFVEAKEILETTLGREHPDYANIVDNLARLYQTLGNYKKAEILMLESIAIREKKLGKQHKDYAISLNGLATLYKEMGDTKKTEQLYLDIIKILEKAVGKKHPYYSLVLSNLANFYSDEGKFQLAENLYHEVINLQKKVLGEAHPDYATSLNVLANLYENVGKYNLAENLYHEVIKIREKAIGKSHPDYLKSINQLANVYELQNRFSDAEALLNEFYRINNANLSNSITFLSEQELKNYMTLNEDRDLLSSYLFTRQNNGVSEGTIPALNYNQALFQKGFLLGSAIRLNNLVNSDLESLDIYNRLKGFRRLLAREYALPITERDSLSVAELEESANKAEKQLARKVSGYDEANRQLDWKDVQIALTALEQKEKTKSAAIEFIHFSLTFPKVKDSNFYAALLILPEYSQPKFITLFNELTLDSLIKFGDNMVTKTNALYASRGASPLNTENILSKNLYNLIWQPLEKHLQDVKTIYFSPAGRLSQFNIDAIPMDNNKVLSDKYNLVQLGSTRQLILAQPLEIKNQTALLFGGIEYDIDSSTVLMVNNGLKTEQPLASRGGINFAQIDSTLRGGSWNYLPGTEKEITDLDKLLQSRGIQSEVYRKFNSTEEAFKHIDSKKIGSPRILHIATHGYFFPNRDQSNAARARVAHDSTTSIATQHNSVWQPGTKAVSSISKLDNAKTEPVFKMSDNPLIRSGLILTGGNYAWKTGKPYKSNMEDGILTAYEISQMNLMNTELVVLSACETGLGDIQGNEGVYGLQRAFKIAGAKYIIMSLWQVPDKQTSLLMTTFYKKWLEDKMSIPAAFHAAQKELRDIGLDPYQWAGFVLVE